MPSDVILVSTRLTDRQLGMNLPLATHRDHLKLGSSLDSTFINYLFHIYSRITEHCHLFSRLVTATFELAPRSFLRRGDVSTDQPTTPPSHTAQQHLFTEFLNLSSPKPEFRFFRARFIYTITPLGPEPHRRLVWSLGWKLSLAVSSTFSLTLKVNCWAVQKPFINNPTLSRILPSISFPTNSP